MARRRREACFAGPLAAAAVIFAISLDVEAWDASDFGTELNWPLCGFDTDQEKIPTGATGYHHPELFPANWTPSDGCPASRRGSDPGTVPPDSPIRSTFGPRPLNSEGGRYDFHRGIDLAAPIGTPVYAIADGVVREAGEHSSYSEPVIIIRHKRPGASSCNSGRGCFHSMYLHMRTDAQGGCCSVSEGDFVIAGQLLGYTGESSSGFAHLHFEIRNAPEEDPYSYWQLDCIHPAGVLPYRSDAAIDANVSVAAVDAKSDTYNVTVELQTTRLDVLGVELSIQTLSGEVVLQSGDTKTEEGAWGYNVRPSSFIFEEWNRQYTHKNSGSVPWADFGEGGNHECPYHSQHDSPPACSWPDCPYSAHYHMDKSEPADSKTGLFNGVRVHLKGYSFYRSGGYWLGVSFEELVIPGGPAEIVATLPLGTGQKNDSVRVEWMAGSAYSQATHYTTHYSTGCAAVIAICLSWVMCHV